MMLVFSLVLPLVLGLFPHSSHVFTLIIRLSTPLLFTTKSPIICHHPSLFISKPNLCLLLDCNSLFYFSDLWTHVQFLNGFSLIHYHLSFCYHSCYISYPILLFLIFLLLFYPLIISVFSFFYFFFISLFLQELEFLFYIFYYWVQDYASVTSYLGIETRFTIVCIYSS